MQTVDEAFLLERSHEVIVDRVLGSQLAGAWGARRADPSVPLPYQRPEAAK
jgi:hypothetical protein